ncbi:MAG: response regulator [Patescibacteria group bacterium]|jgi:DNA-binding response OmpR family regulator
MYQPKVLILDDDSDFLEGMSSVLEDAGCDYIATSDSNTIQQKIRSYQPNLIILDVFLKDNENGINIAQLLKDAKDTNGIPILMVSGHDQAKEYVRSIGTNGYSYLSKPFSSNELVKKIYQLI